VTPPGSLDIRRFTSRCTACQLCVVICPTQVLRPSLLDYGLSGGLQPRLVYASGACSYDCARCGEVCPTGAIEPLPLDIKRRVQIGRARFIEELCVVSVKMKACGACSEHCPTKALKMVPIAGIEPGLTIPRLNEVLCIGCGACEHPCPVKPEKAIFVEALSQHGLALAPSREEMERPAADGAEFPF
jgi:ferredoxin